MGLIENRNIQNYNKMTIRQVDLIYKLTYDLFEKEQISKKDRKSIKGDTVKVTMMVETQIGTIVYTLDSLSNKQILEIQQIKKDEGGEFGSVKTPSKYWASRIIRGLLEFHKQHGKNAQIEFVRQNKKEKKCT